MAENLTAEAISRRKALALLGLATAAFAASSVVAAPMLRPKRRVWSAVRKDAEAGRTGVRRGALAARRGVKKGASHSYPDAPARIRTEDLFGFAGAALIAGAAHLVWAHVARRSTGSNSGTSSPFWQRATASALP